MNLLFNSNLWLDLHKIACEPTNRVTTKTELSANLKTGSGYRTGLGMRYLLSSVNVLLFHEQRPELLVELKQFWTAESDFRNWKFVLSKLRAFVKRNPKTTTPFDDFMSESNTDTDSSIKATCMSLFKKIAFIPDVKSTDIPQRMNEFHHTVMSDCQELIAKFDLNLLFLRIGQWHCKFTKISPFRFGNRVIRLWIGHVLMFFGCLPLPCSPKSLYMNAVRTEDPVKLTAFFIQQNYQVRQAFVNIHGDELADTSNKQSDEFNSNYVSSLKKHQCGCESNACVHEDNKATGM